MPNVLPFLKREFNVRQSVSAIKENRKLLKDPDYFWPYSIQTFVGEQGDGKTISLIWFAQKIMQRYPKAIVVSNVQLFDRKAVTIEQFLSNRDNFDTANDYIFYSSKDDYLKVNTSVRNGKLGVILITDEWQNYFSNQDSKNVPPWFLEQVAQNRKQLRVHLCTSQDYDQLVKAARRRADTVFKCKTYAIPFISAGSIFTIVWAYSAKKLQETSSGLVFPSPLKTGFFFHSKKLRDSFDTHQVIFTGETSEYLQVQSPAQTVELGKTLSIKRRRTMLRPR